MENRNPQAGNFLLILLVMCLSGYSGLATAEDRPQLLAGSSDFEIHHTLEPLLPIAADQMQRYDADKGLVLTRRTFQTDGDSYFELQDLVWWVRQGEAEDLTNFVRDFDYGVDIEEVQAFLIRPGEFTLDGSMNWKIIRLDSDRIRISQSGKDKRSANLVIGFDTAQPGDLLGVSILTHEDRPLSWAIWLAAEYDPVARAELRLKCDWERAYAIFGSRFLPGQMNQEILAEQNGQITDLRLWADSIDPILNEPYSPPDHLQSPQFSVAWRATRVRINTGWIWYYIKHWNQVAVDVSNYESRLLEKSKKTAKQAEELAAGLEGRDAADAMYLFVRDELLDVTSSFYYAKKEAPTVDEILEGRSGDAWDKSFVLLAMYRSMGLTADIVWAHDPERGSYFEKYPSWGQMSEPLVRVKIEGLDYWYDIQCGGCVPGMVRSKLQDTEALVHQTNTWKLDDRLWDQVIADAQGRDVNLFQFYMEYLKKKPWSKVIQTPGRTGKWAGWSEEKIVFGSDPEDGTAGDLVIHSVGRTAIKGRVDAEEDPADAGKDWALFRYEPIQDATVLNVSPEGADTLMLELELEYDSPFEPMGDTWILPPDLVYGRPSVTSWTGIRVTDFYIPRTTQSRWSFEVPLPPGWDDVELPKNRIVNAVPVTYQVKYGIRDGRFVVSRILIKESGTVRDGSKVEGIGKKIDIISDLETTPVVLRKKAGGP